MCIRVFLNIFIFYVNVASFAAAFGQSDSDVFSLEPKGDPLVDLRPTDVIHWQGVDARVSGREVEVGLRLTTDQNFTLYVDKVSFSGPPASVVTKIEGPQPKSIVDPIEGGTVKVYTAGDFVIHLTTLEPFQDKWFPMSVTFLGCTERICLFPFTVNLKLEAYQITQEAVVSTKGATVSAAETGPDRDRSQSVPPSSQVRQSDKVDLQQILARQIKQGDLSIILLLGVLFLGGLLTNLTPCVFPMIPITLRILGRQSDAKWLHACLYALGIMMTYSALGIVAGLSGGVFGAYAGGTTFNVAFGLVFVIFALSMLGFGNFSFLQSLGAKWGSGASGPVNTLLMGAGAGLVAAPCTGPILGSLLAYTASQQTPILTISFFVVYSLGFALPYVLLGGFASSASRLKVSAKVQVAVKLGFAAIMFALALYYLRIPLRSILAPIHGHWLLSATIFLVVGLAWCIRYLFSNDTNKYRSILPSLVLGIGAFALVQNISGGDLEVKIKWQKSLEQGIALARQLNRPLLLDGWADWCAACKEMDVTTYQDDRIKQELSRNWVTVKIDFTELTDELDAFAQRYQMHGLPVTILLPSSGDLANKHRMTGYISADSLLTQLTQFRSP